MAISQPISELNKVETTLDSTDLFLMSKTSLDGYESKKIDFGTLMENINTRIPVASLDGYINTLSVADNLDDSEKLVAGRKAVKQALAGYVDTTTNQNISGIKEFRECPKSMTNPSGNDKTEIVNVSYLNERLRRSKYTYTPIIDWDYVDQEGNKNGQTLAPTGAKFSWKNFAPNNVNYTSVYEDGRYARYVVPLKYDFRDFDKLLIIPSDRSTDGTPDMDPYLQETDVFDFMLNFPINKKIRRFDTVMFTNEPGFRWLWIPYGGSGFGYNNTKWYAKSTPTRLVTFYHGSHCYPICEIYGLNRQ